MWSQVGLRKHHYEVVVMEFQLSYSKSWKMMLWKCYTQYASKFGKLSSGHRTGKGQFSFQSQRNAVPKNVQTTAQLHSSHTLAESCSNFSKPCINSLWAMNFQIFKLDLEKTEERKIKLPTFVGSWKNKENSTKNIFFCFIDYAKAFDSVSHNKLWKILQLMGIPDLLKCILWNMYAGQEATVRTGHGTMDWFQIGKGVCWVCVLLPCLFNVMRIHYA